MTRFKGLSGNPNRINKTLQASPNVSKCAKSSATPASSLLSLLSHGGWDAAFVLTEVCDWSVCKRVILGSVVKDGLAVVSKSLTLNSLKVRKGALGFCCSDSPASGYHHAQCVRLVLGSHHRAIPLIHRVHPFLQEQCAVHGVSIRLNLHSEVCRVPNFFELSRIPGESHVRQRAGFVGLRWERKGKVAATHDVQ